MSDDATLLRQFADERAEAAFAEVVRRHLDLVYGAALRRTGGNAHQAADVAQEVFVKLARDAARLAQHPALPAWLYATTRNAALDVRRAERRRQAREREAAAMREPSVTHAAHEGAADWERVRPLLDDAMDELGEREREAVVLRFFARRSFGEIGATLRVSEDAARMRVERALEKLRARLARRGVTSTGAALGVMLAGEAMAAPVPAGLAASVASAAATGSAGAVGMPGLAWVLAMKTSTMASVTAVALALLAATLAVRSVGELRATERAVDVARRDWDHLAAAWRDEERHSRRVSAEIAQWREREAAVTRAVEERVEVRTVKAGGKSEEPGHVAAGRAYLARHPEARAAIVAWKNAKVRFQFAELYRELGLSPAQIETFEAVVGGNILFGDWGPHGQFLEFDVGTGTPEGTRDERLRALLGEAGLRRYREEERARTAREWTAQVGGRLFFSEAPLTQPQSEQLVRLLAATPRRREWDAAYWTTVLERSAGFLTARQHDALASVRALQETYRSVDEAQEAVEPPPSPHK